VRTDSERLRDILEAIERVERYVIRGRQAFERDELLQTWAVHQLQIIGEASANLTDALKEEQAEIPWAQIVAMRNILVHDYFGVSFGEVWAVIERDLPDLKRKIQAILQKLKDQP